MRERFFFKYCRNGHMLYAVGQEIQQKNCEICGEIYLDKCENCSSQIPNSFVSTYLPTLGKVASLPKRPKFCGSCGAIYPWTQKEHERIEKTGIWAIMHPEVTRIAKSRFDTGHYADAVEATFKHINNKIKKIYKDVSGQELDGVSLMRKALTPSGPVILFDDLGTETGKNIQQGYMDIFAGSMSAIRNPKAHDNIDITQERCVHFLVLGSLLLNKLEEKIKL